MNTSPLRNGWYIPTLGILLATSACIKNDLPYPHIQANFTELNVEEQTRTAVLDTVNLVATVYLNEAADIQDVRVTSLKLTPGARLQDSIAFVSGVNLSDPITVTLSLYQDYEWTVKARQDIERYFTVKGQIGTSVIDVDNHTVSTTIGSGATLDAVTVESIKLGGEGATMIPSLEGRIVDFSAPVEVEVVEHGRTTVWTITIERTQQAVAITHIDAWTQVAWIYAEAEATRNNQLQYRLMGQTAWQSVPESWISRNGGSFTGRLIHLEPLSTYEVRALSDDVYSDIIEFTTGAALTLPNSTFTDWWLDGKVWCPWAEDGEPYWGTGNKGATTLGNSNTVPIYDPESLTGYEGAELESRFVGISILGKLAAGNLFAGRYVATDGTNGILDFGREFSERPTRLKARIKYSPVAITHTSTDFTDLKGRMDTCVVWCALGDWDVPYEIRTNPNNRRLFDENDEGVIAYGRAQFGYEIADYVDLDIPLDYKSTSRVPRYILVVASASKYGDYFTGGNGSVLCVKEFGLGYDYDDDAQE
ncbi:MAG: PCMD domain-containing protein [Bacteroidales bacterium]|nr:PCMD domain-containing protein [Bacteroidales bacterium]